MKFLKKDSKVYFKDAFNFETFIQFQESSYINFVDEGPGTDINMDLAINEFDPSLRSAINFSDPESYKAMICPIGLEELRMTTYYELMNLQTLIVGTKINQIMMDCPQRFISEIEFLGRGYILANPVIDTYNKISNPSLENNLKKVISSEKSSAQAKISNEMSKRYFNIISKKNKSRAVIEK